MKREIKFRVWDKEEKTWLTAASAGSYVDTAIAFPESLTLEQFTGLHDKNGKEIYEGDIVKHWYGKGKVFMRLGCWYIENYKELGYCDSQEVAIIGDIYTTPELLK